MASSNSNKKLVPEAMSALDKFKYEVANEIGVTLKDGYNGDIAPQQVWAEIFRSVVQNANQENVETSKLYDEMEGYQQLFSELKKQGIDVPTIREINASNKNKLRNMKNKRTKSK